MLTTDTGLWADGETRQVWAIEFDTEYGDMQVLGPAEILHDRGYLESDVTGSCYSEPQAVASMVEIRSAGNHYLAVFDSEEALTAGAHLLAITWEAILPASVYLALHATGNPA
jgi:hypothetical protein